MMNRPSPLSRDTFLSLLAAAQAVDDYSFARQAALKWLAYYPGDLQAGLHYARALAGERRYRQALQILEGLARADPEDAQVAQAALDLLAGWERDNAKTEETARKKELPWEANSQTPESRPWRNHLFALTGQGQGKVDPWAETLWQARLALGRGEIESADAMTRQALQEDQPHLLAYLMHLHLLAANRRISLEGRIALAEQYHQRWGDCLTATLYLADWLLQGGDSERAVALIHQVAARDVGGQTASRLWGKQHAYRALWPEQLELNIDLPIPARVAAEMGWNRLASGSNVPELDVDSEYSDENENDEKLENVNDETPEGITPTEDGGKNSEQTSHMQHNQALVDHTPTRKQAQSPTTHKEERRYPVSGPTRIIDPEELQQRLKQPRSIDPALRLADSELDRLSAHASLPGANGLDGRFPIYVIFSLRNRLQAVYGAQGLVALEQEMHRLADIVEKWRGWGAMVFLPDDPANLASLGMKAVRSGDPWELKHALSDLDERLKRQGKRIGAVLIVGGPEIVPFHHLPNPVDDQDEFVASDNPYASRDRNYFIPEWPVGRLPGGAENEVEFLVSVLQKIQRAHQQANRRASGTQNWIERLKSWWQRWAARQKASYGYTAAIWRESAAQVFRPIGKIDQMYVSPPLGLYELALDAPAHRTIDPAASQLPNLNGRLGYYNLHGWIDTPDWYGHRDPLGPNYDPEDEIDYPVALRPQDIRLQHGKTIPLVVFSEACYGLHLDGRSVDESIALQFLQAGSLAVAGSTCMSYGSIAGPLTAADLLGQAFWSFTQRGMPAGEALRQAKIYLAREMQHRHGWLNGEDQKTLISFLLYGDPLVQAVRYGRAPKSVRYRQQALTQVKTVCDRANGTTIEGGIPTEVMASVKQALTRYLPGMVDAQMIYARERVMCEGCDHSCPTSQLAEGAQFTPKSCEGQITGRSLVTLSKRKAVRQSVHLEVARLTLDSQGKLVKLVVSR